MLLLLSTVYYPSALDPWNPLIYYILALITPPDTLLSRFLPLLKCRLVHPPPPASQYFSRLNYKGASLGNIYRERSFIFQKSGEDNIYRWSYENVLWIVFILQSHWPSEHHKIYSINIIFVPMLLFPLRSFYYKLSTSTFKLQSCSRLD